jgi:hypothetical protein
VKIPVSGNEERHEKETEDFSLQKNKELQLITVPLLRRNANV